MKAFSTDFYAKAPIDRQLAALRDWLSVNPASALKEATDEGLLTLLKMNAGYRLMSELDEKNRFFFIADDAIEYDAKGVEKILKKDDGQGLKTLKTLRDTFAEISDWTPTTLEAAVTEYVNASGLGLGKVAQPIRLAVSGTSVSPPIYDTLAFLGKDRTLTRIDRCVSLYA